MMIQLIVYFEKNRECHVDFLIFKKFNSLFFFGFFFALRTRGSDRMIASKQRDRAIVKDSCEDNYVEDSHI